MVFVTKKFGTCLRCCYVCYHHWMIMKLWLTSFNFFFFFSILYTTFFSCVFSLHTNTVGYLLYWRMNFGKLVQSSNSRAILWSKNVENVNEKKRKRCVLLWFIQKFSFTSSLSQNFLFFVFILSRYMWKHASSISVILIFSPSHRTS